jgi:putative membrane protein
MKAVTTTVAMIAAVCMAGAAAAQTSPSSTTTPTTPSAGQTTLPPQARTGADREAARLDGKDESFLKQAAQNGHAEVEASKLAQTKATQADVKSFAGKMVEEHQKASQELAALASSKGVKLPEGPSLMQKAKLKMLSGADGAKFDKRYAENFGVKAHEDTVKLFKNAAAGAKDADVKAFAQKTLPTLEQHLTMARSMEATVAPTAAGKPADRSAGTDAADRGTAKSGATGKADQSGYGTEPKKKD